MRKHFNQVIQHPLITGSIVIFFGTFLANIIHYFFQLFMYRTLSVEENGVLAAIISLFTLPSFASNAIIPTVVSFSGAFFAKNELQKIKRLYIEMSKVTLGLGLFFLLMFVLFSPQIGKFFHVRDISLIAFAGGIVFMSFMCTVNLAMLQGKMAFGYISFSSFVAAVVKLFFGILLVTIGFSVKGALGAIISSSAALYLITMIPLWKIIRLPAVAVTVSKKEILAYGVPSAIALASLTSFISTDIILVKHFFSEFDTGLYAGLSLIGRVIFFFSAPITTVMFPMIVRKHANNENYHKTFLLALSLIAGLSIALTGFYTLFPEFTIVFFLKKQDYLAISPYLPLFGIFITLYSIASIVINFFLSIKMTNVYKPVLGIAILQIVFIALYHESFWQVISISVSLVSLLLIALLLYYIKLLQASSAK